MESKQDKKGPNWLWVGILIAVGLVFWGMTRLQPTSTPQTAIPYSAFLDQVNAGNVARVQISGGQIAGVLVNPLLSSQLAPVPAPSTQAAETPPAPQLIGDFTTTFPDTVGDPNLVSLLRSHKVVIEVRPPTTSWLMTLLVNGLPVLLLVGVFVWMSRRASGGGQSGVMNFGRTKARRYKSDLPGVTFEDVAGAEEAKAELQEVVDFLRRPEKYHEIGARIPSGVLLVGPPGTGKTLMARAVAGEAGVPFYHLSASEFVEMFVGVGASRVRDLFEQAKANAPAIVFIDEMDAVGRRRGAGLGNVNDEREQTLNQLLVELDGFDERHEIIVLAATNRPDVLDPALLRPGRFDRQVTIGLPDRVGREAILRIHTKSLTLAGEVDLNRLARSTAGFSGADLANLCNEAALIAARQDHKNIGFCDFEDAMDKVVLGDVRSLLINDHDRRVIAYHEAGHAIVAWLTPGADGVRKVTIIPRGRALGVTEQIPGDDRYNYSREDLLARLAVMMGGRVAEEITFGDITTGAENDLVEATRLARRMITRWGMGSLGPVAFQVDDEQPFLGYQLSQGRDYSETTATLVDQDVRRLLEERSEAARQLLVGARDCLDALVKALLQEETLDGDELQVILGPRPELILELPLAVS